MNKKDGMFIIDDDKKRLMMETSGAWFDMVCDARNEEFNLTAFKDVMKNTFKILRDIDFLFADWVPMQVAEILVFMAEFREQPIFSNEQHAAKYLTEEMLFSITEEGDFGEHFSRDGKFVIPSASVQIDVETCDLSELFDF